jgi:hypothetical protein
MYCFEDKFTLNQASTILDQMAVIGIKNYHLIRFSYKNRFSLYCNLIRIF